MKTISLITLNNPGLEAALKTADDLLRIDPDFNIKIYGKQEISFFDDLDNNNYIQYSELNNILYELWYHSDAIIWFAATGIVVRKIAPFLGIKTTDPAILVINMQRTQVIPLLSGHIGGANDLAQKLTQVNSDLTTFITTATDSLGIFAFDNFAKNAGYEIKNIENLPKVSNSLINKEPVNLVSYPVILNSLEIEGLYGNIKFFNFDTEWKLNHDYPTVVISPFDVKQKRSLVIKIKPITLGIGLNKGTSMEEAEANIIDFLKENNLNIEDVKTVASYEAKKDEMALNLFAEKYGMNLVFFNDNDINNLDGVFSKSKAEEFFNIKGVAEPTAVLAAPLKTLFIKKKTYKNITLAAAF